MSIEENAISSNIQYLRVIADMRPKSLILPMKVIYDDEREFIVTKIIDIKKFIVPVCNELCYAYYCKFKEKLRILYLDKDNNWFVIINKKKI